MLQPRRVKYRKAQRGTMGGIALRGNKVSFGEYGLMALEHGWITARQIESARRAIIRRIRKGGKMWVRIFPDKPVTKKPAETRMGGGKGSVDHWVAVVKRGRILFEVEGVDEDTVREAFRIASIKLPIATKMVKRDES